MQRLSKVIGIDGFTMTQIKREGNIALYEQEKDGHTYGYEVIIVKILPAFTNPAGTFFPKREGYPKPEDGGILAKTFKEYRDAVNIYNDCLDRKKEIVFFTNKKDGQRYILIESKGSAHLVKKRTLTGLHISYDIIQFNENSQIDIEYSYSKLHSTKKVFRDGIKSFLKVA